MRGFGCVPRREFRRKCSVAAHTASLQSKLSSEAKPNGVSKANEIFGERRSALRFRLLRYARLYSLNTILRTVVGSLIERLGSCPSPGKRTINFPGRAI